MPTLRQRLVRKMPLHLVSGEGQDATQKLERSIGLVGLTAMGVGSTIGTGIFFVLQIQIPNAGPAIVFSFIAAGIVAGLTALCYAELAGAIPVSGSSYSYAYVSLGELMAVVVAASLMLEYGISAAAVSVGWSGYLNKLLLNLTGVQLPQALSAAPWDANPGIINLPAVVLVFLCALLLLKGARESAISNTIMVILKVCVLLAFIGIGATGWNSDHLADFAPFGARGVWVATAGIFFSYIGLDTVSTAGDEVRDPQRTMPRAIVLALGIVTVIYVGVALVAVGAQPWQAFAGQEAGLAQILQDITGQTWPGTMVAAGAVISIFSVTLVSIYGQTRILFTISRDGLLPPFFARVNPRTRVPAQNTVFVSIVVALLADFVPLDHLADLTSIGTLVAFSVVSSAVIILRRQAPDLPRTFKVPGYPVTPILSVLVCLMVISGLRAITLLAFLVWTGVFLIYYFFYGMKHSVLEQLDTSDQAEPSLY